MKDFKYDNLLFVEDCIRTNSGKYINVFNPDPTTIDIDDIAHGLSHACRFGGQVPKFYSVAQHCVEGVKLVDDYWKLEMLLHDATEGIMCDLASPIKRRIPQYKIAEENLMRCIANKFKLKFPFGDTVHIADEHLLRIEFQTMMIDRNIDNCWSPEKSKQQFLQTFYSISR